METTLLVLAFAVITGYIINISSKHKALVSISESDYWLEKPWKWVFEATMGICGGSLIFTGIFGLEKVAWLVIIGGVGILLVGVFSRFKLNKLFRTMHMVGAIGGFTALGLSFWLSFGDWWYSLVVVIAAVGSWFLSKDKGIRIWNIEIILIYTIFIGLIILL